jgi:ABC-type multidrug transport system permease subunit
MLFAGFFVTPDLMPVWLRWASYLCTLTYSVRIFLVSEFEDCSVQNCVTLLDNVEANPNDTWWYWLALVLLFVVFRISAIVMLRKKATKFF